MIKQKKMIENELLKKYITGSASQDEKESVQLWLEADKANMKEFMTLRSLYDITLANLDKMKMEAPVTNNRSIYKEILKMAAVALVAVGMSYTMFLYYSSRIGDEATMQSLFVPAGQRAELTLADGTVVWLNAQTTLTFPNRFESNKREVILNGEGYFNVARDESRSFTVRTDLYDINVLGTEFNVSAYSKNKRFEASLVKGSVELLSKKGDEKVRLSPGEYVTMVNSTLEVKTIEHHEYFLWKDGILSFEDQKLEDIVNKLSLIYDIRIENYNSTITDVTRTCKFHTKDGIEHAMNVLKIAFGFQYRKNDNINKIVIW